MKRGLALLLALAVVVSCKQEEEPTPVYPQWTNVAPAPPAPPVTPSATPVPAPAPAPAPVTGSPFEGARQLCVTRINEYRARLGVAPVTRRVDAEACGDAQARSDATSRSAHGVFGQCRERAQNECPGWPGAPEEVIDKCLAMMFGEGPGGGHYENIIDRKYRSVACGIVAAAGGELWVVQNFYP